MHTLDQHVKGSVDWRYPKPSTRAYLKHALQKSVLLLHSCPGLLHTADMARGLVRNLPSDVDPDIISAFIEKHDHSE